MSFYPPKQLWVCGSGIIQGTDPQRHGRRPLKLPGQGHRAYDVDLTITAAVAPAAARIAAGIDGRDEDGLVGSNVAADAVGAASFSAPVDPVDCGPLIRKNGKSELAM